MAEGEGYYRPAHFFPGREPRTEGKAVWDGVEVMEKKKTSFFAGNRTTLPLFRVSQ